MEWRVEYCTRKTRLSPVTTCNTLCLVYAWPLAHVYMYVNQVCKHTVNLTGVNYTCTYTQLHVHTCMYMYVQTVVSLTMDLRVHIQWTPITFLIR